MQTMYVKSFSDALYALTFGSPGNFNVAMQTIKNSGQFVPSPVQRIEDYTLSKAA